MGQLNAGNDQMLHPSGTGLGTDDIDIGSKLGRIKMAMGIDPKKSFFGARERGQLGFYNGIHVCSFAPAHRVFRR
jgi:hypothetical protein